MSDKKTKKQKLAVKIALITFAVITVLMVSLVVINISVTKVVTTSDYSDLSREIGNAKSRELTNWFNSYLLDLNVYAESEVVKTGNNEKVIEWLQHNTRLRNKDYDYMFFCGKDGTTYRDTGLKGAVGGILERDYYKAIFQDGKKTYIGNVILSKTSGQYVVPITKAAVDENGRTFGFFTAMLGLETLKKEIAEISICETGYMFLTDSSDTIIAHPNSDMILQKFTKDENSKTYYSAQGQSIISMNRSDGKKLRVTITEIQGAPGWNISIVIPNAQIAKAKYYPSLYMQHKDVEQVHMIIAFESLDYYDPERYILSVVNSLLGGNVNSRLFQTIREEMGLSYAIYSYGGSYEKGGLFHIYAAVHPNQVRPVLKAVVDIIQKLKKELVSDRELYIVKESVKTDLIISDESTYNRISNYGKSYIHGETIETVEEAAEKIGQVTAEEVRAFVQKHFDLSQMSLSLVGDLKTLPREEMEELWMTYRTEKA